jgi:hypothetical protein
VFAGVSLYLGRMEGPRGDGYYWVLTIGSEHYVYSKTREDRWATKYVGKLKELAGAAAEKIARALASKIRLCFGVCIPSWAVDAVRSAFLCLLRRMPTRRALAAFVEEFRDVLADVGLDPKELLPGDEDDG